MVKGRLNDSSQTRSIADGFAQLNVFHWHVVDSQSFPLEVEAFPELSQRGAYDASSVYTVDDVKEIVRYAGEVRSSITIDALT